MMMVVRILQKVTKDLEEHKQHCQEFFMREMEKQKNLFKNLRASIIQKGLNPLHTQ